MSATDDLRASLGMGGVTLKMAHTYALEPIAWLWRGWLARGKVHILAGAPGTGKTSIAMAMAGALTIGARWPDGTQAPAGEVVIWSGEDDPSDTLIPRLMAAGADLRKVHVIASALDEGDTRSRPFDPASDMELLSEEIAVMDPAPALLIVDPIVSAVAGDSHKNGEVRRALQPLVDLAMTRKIAVLGITHFSKSTAGRDPVERVTGSIAFGALARIVLAAAKLPEEQGGGRILARGKSNIGRDDGGFRYDLEVLEVQPGVETTCVMWGEAVEGSAREILGQAEVLEDPEDRNAWQEARAFLREVLADGPRKASEVLKEARAAGITDKSIRTARERLGITPYKSTLTLNGAWMWKLPGTPKMPSSTEDAQDAQENGREIGHLLGQVDPDAEDAHRRCPFSRQKNGASWASSADEGIFEENSTVGEDDEVRLAL